MQYQEVRDARKEWWDEVSRATREDLPGVVYTGLCLEDVRSDKELLLSDNFGKCDVNSIGPNSNQTNREWASWAFAKQRLSWKSCE